MQEQRIRFTLAPLSTILKHTCHCQHPGQKHALTSHHCLSSSFFVSPLNQCCFSSSLPSPYCCTLGVLPSCTAVMRGTWPDLWGTLIIEGDRLLAISVVNTGRQTSSKSEDQCQIESRAVFNGVSIACGCQCFIWHTCWQNLYLTFSLNLLQTSQAHSPFKVQKNCQCSVLHLISNVV